MQSAQHIYETAFSQHRTPRSDVYKAGALNCLRLLESGADFFATHDGVLAKCSDKAGTAEFDAYMAGVQEGRDLWQANEKDMAAKTK